MTKIDQAALDKLLEGVDPSDPQAMFSDAGLFGQLQKALAKRMLQAESGLTCLGGGSRRARRIIMARHSGVMEN